MTRRSGPARFALLAAAVAALSLTTACAAGAIASDPPAGSTAPPSAAATRAATPVEQNLEQAISDKAQSTTIAFSGLALITGNLDAQSFFPPGKLADYWGFQYLRDNDPSDMGHNTSFLTRAACNVLHTLDDGQFAQLKTLATSQVDQINQYGYDRYPLMQAFRQLVDGDLPAGSTGLSLVAVKATSSALYRVDGQISYDRAVAYADIYRSLSTDQRAYLDAMVGKGWSAWPDVDESDGIVQARMKGLTHDQGVAVMTYAGDLYSWYAGSLDADVYFCPERHGTYYGGFYIKDAPAVGVPGYSIDEQLTAVAGSAVCDSSQGYVTDAQAKLVSSLVDTQRQNLYAGKSNIVEARTAISSALRSLRSAEAPSAAELAAVKATVLARSAEYGALDGEDNYRYATVFAQLRASLSDAQMTRLAALRHLRGRRAVRLHHLHHSVPVLRGRLRRVGLGPVSGRGGRPLLGDTEGDEGHADPLALRPAGPRRPLPERMQRTRGRSPRAGHGVPRVYAGARAGRSPARWSPGRSRRASGRPRPERGLLGNGPLHALRGRGSRGRPA